jgi:methionyl-tRNA synthetase
MAAYRVHDALAAAMELARIANGWIEERQPWSLAKAEAKDPEAAKGLDETLSSLARALAALTALFQPIAPAKMAELAAQLGLDGIPTLDASRTIRLAGRRVTRGAPLFPKVDPAVFEGL